MVGVVDVRQALIAKTLRVPAAEGPAGDGGAVARGLDVALLSAGFKCSRSCSTISPGCIRRSPRTRGRPRSARSASSSATTSSTTPTSSTSRSTSRHVEFWSKCVAEALQDPRSAGNVATELTRRVVNLLDLPSYGRYQHTYEELLAAHDELIPAAGDRVTVLGLGRSLAEESTRSTSRWRRPGAALGGRPGAAGGAGGVARRRRAAGHDSDPREPRGGQRRAPAARARAGARHAGRRAAPRVRALRGRRHARPATRFRSLRRAERRALLAGLDAVAARQARRRQPLRRAVQAPGGAAAPARVPAVAHAQDVFAVARGERTARSLAGRAEPAVAAGDVDGAVGVLAEAPGCSCAAGPARPRGAGNTLVDAVSEAVPASGRACCVAAPAPRQPGGAGRRAAVRRPAEPRVGHGRARDRSPRPPWPSSPRCSTRRSRAGCRTFGGSSSNRTCGRRLPLTAKGRPDGLGIVPRGSISR